MTGQSGMAFMAHLRPLRPVAAYGGVMAAAAVALADGAGAQLGALLRRLGIVDPIGARTPRPRVRRKQQHADETSALLCGGASEPPLLVVKYGDSRELVPPGLNGYRPLRAS